MKKKAFTIIEALISVVILEIGILGVAGFISYGFNIAQIAREETTAANLASGLLDEKLALTFDTLTVGTGPKVRYSDDSASPFYDWQEKVDVSFLDSDINETATETSMKKIAVTVYWRHGGTERQFQTASIKAKH